jgi:hypothetical protein
MRITVSHDRKKEDAMRIVDTATDQVLRPMFGGVIRITNVQKQWQGSRLLFSLMAGVSVAQAPIKGWILVTDTDITIDCDLPSFLENLLPQSVRSNVQSAIRALLK